MQEEGCGFTVSLGISEPTLLPEGTVLRPSLCQHRCSPDLKVRGQPSTRTSDEEDGSHAGGSSRRSHGWWGLLPSSAAEALPPQVNRGSSSHPTFILGKRRAWLHLLCEALLKTITRVPPQPPPFHVKQSRLAHPLTGLVTLRQPLPVRRRCKTTGRRSGCSLTSMMEVKNLLATLLLMFSPAQEKPAAADSGSPV